MRHGNAAATISREEWLGEFRPALYRQLARQRRAAHAREDHALVDLLGLVEVVLGATSTPEPATQTTDDPTPIAETIIRARMLREQAQLIRTNGV